MNRYGLTQREKAIWPPDPKPDGFDLTEKCFWFALFAILLSLVIHMTIEPKGTTPIVKNATGMLSDRQQEQKYCAAWATQEIPVVGGTTDAIRNHCNKFL